MLSIAACGDVKGGSSVPEPSPNAPAPVEQPKNVMYCTHLGMYPICCCKAEYDALGRIMKLSGCEKGLTILEPSGVVIAKKDKDLE
jgi:hypothetical protein